MGTGGHESVYLFVHPYDRSSHLGSNLGVANSGTLAKGGLDVLRNVDHLVNLQVGRRTRNQRLGPRATVHG